ncbi:MAG TPA: hypothetical protein VG755_34630 [Nannocystaceae bacterium]|nr:hypothetical protein [Nannocystaceae bacterium]
MMPSFDDLLQQTMLATACRGGRLPLRTAALDRGPFRSPAPICHPFETLDFLEHEDAALHNQIWRFGWDPAAPGTFTDVTINTRGMGMNYAMPMPALTKVEFRSCQVKRHGEPPLDLFLSPEFLVGAWWSHGGKIHAHDGRLWPLEAKIDAGLVAVFAYQVGDCGVAPLTMAEMEELDDLLIPPLGSPPRLGYIAGETASSWVCVGASRYILAVELVLAKERPDFVPGSMIGFARIGPHALFWSNEALDQVEISIILERPAKISGCGDPAMKERVGALMVSDTNDAHSLDAVVDLPIPYTDNLYDYYQTEAFEYLRAREPHGSDHPQQRPDEVTFANSCFKRERILEDAVVRRTPGVSNDTAIRKCRRQGQFDNVHLAARMRAEFVDHRDGEQQVVLDDIVMINMCLHDCVHMHVRWSEFLDGEDSNMLHGWGSAGPYTQPGVPQVPKNQTVFGSLPTRHSLRYRALAAGVEPGVVQVFCHHGCAYAVDAWPTVKAKGKILGLQSVIRERAAAQNDAYAYWFPPGWLEFYWRVRWIRQDGMIRERLAFDLDKCL